MSRRRRFDIDLPEDDTPADADAPRARRGPMATAVGETAKSLKTRREIEDGIRAENDALAHEFVRLRGMGLVIAQVPVGDVATAKLVRDRKGGVDAEIGELKTSIREIGLSNPIQVEETGDGTYELIQGFRRLRSFVELHDETGDDRYAAIPAIVLAGGETLEQSYRRMVDENLVRADISFAEMGELARAYAASEATACDSADDAVAVLFKSAGYQKRTYIRGFARLMGMIGPALAHPEAVSRNLGLAVLRRLEAEPGTQAALLAELDGAGDAKAEQGVLTAFANGAGETEAGKAAGKAKPGPARARAKTTFRVETGGREVKCIAGTQRLELSGDTDFSAYERDRLERAVAAFFGVLDGE